MRGSYVASYHQGFLLSFKPSRRHFLYFHFLRRKLIHLWIKLHKFHVFFVNPPGVPGLA